MDHLADSIAKLSQGRKNWYTGREGIRVDGGLGGKCEPQSLFQSLYDFFAEIRNYSIFFWLSLPVHSGSLKRIDYPK